MTDRLKRSTLWFGTRGLMESKKDRAQNPMGAESSGAGPLEIGNTGSGRSGTPGSGILFNATQGSASGQAGAEKPNGNPPAGKVVRKAAGRARRNVLPTQKMETLPQRTSDDMRRNRQPEGSTLQQQLSHQLLSLLQGLQAVQGVPQSRPQETAVSGKTIPPPLGQAAGVVPSQAARRQERLGGSVPLEEPVREKKLLPFRDQDAAPLPELVTVESMELDSEVAQAWGSSAVIRPGRLRWVGRIIYLLLAVALGYLALDFLMFRQGDDEEPVTSAAPDGEAPETYECRQVLAGFLLTDNNRLKARYLREGIHLLPLMSDHAKRAAPLPTVIETFSVKREETLAGKRFLFAEGTFRDGTSLSPVFEQVDSEFLLDWRSLVGYSEASLRDLSEKMPLVQTVAPLLRLVVQEGGENETTIAGSAEKFRSFKVYMPVEDFACMVVTLKNSRESRELNDALRSEDVAGKVMIRLRAQEIGDAGRMLFVDEFVGAGWLQP